MVRLSSPTISVSHPKQTPVLLMSLDSHRPAWFQHHQKRVIPNHLEAKKKLLFQILSDDKKLTTTQKLVVDDGFNLLTFGSSQRGDKLTIFDDLRMDDTVSEHAEEVAFGDDQPPLRSIHDLTQEVLLSKPRQKVDSLLNKDPARFPLVFLAPLPTTKEPKSQRPEKQELAVIVFGYSESRSREVIAYFSEVGKILEPFDLNGTTTMLTQLADRNRQVPIFCGPTWVKITYEDRDQALDALKRNGKAFNGEFIGVIPYSKDALEAIQNRQLDPNEDRGAWDLKLVNRKPNDDNAAAMLPPLLALTLEMKDGLKLFLKSDASLTKPDDKTKMLWVESAKNWFFGFYEL